MYCIKTLSCAGINLVPCSLVLNLTASRQTFGIHGKYIFYGLYEKCLLLFSFNCKLLLTISVPAYSVLLAGDDRGSVWLYDVASSVLEGKSKDLKQTQVRARDKWHMYNYIVASNSFLFRYRTI